MRAASWASIASFDRGASWTDLRLGLPRLAVVDLVVHPRDNDLVIATHARGLLHSRRRHAAAADCGRTGRRRGTGAVPADAGRALHPGQRYERARQSRLGRAESAVRRHPQLLPAGGSSPSGVSIQRRRSNGADRVDLQRTGARGREPNELESLGSVVVRAAPREAGRPRRTRRRRRRRHVDPRDSRRLHSAPDGARNDGPAAGHGSSAIRASAPTTADMDVWHSVAQKIEQTRVHAAPRRRRPGRGRAPAREPPG